MTNQNSILLQTLQGKKTDRPPVWFMRQAGRVLPNYNALKEKYTFRQLMESPQLASDVTLMPIADLGVDAAILFSDILVIPQAMGMDLEFRDSGPIFTNPLATLSHPEKSLNPDSSKLTYIYNVIDEISKSKSENTPLIGFCGSPFTVLLYMLQGLHRKSEFPDAIQFIYQNKKSTLHILDQITELSIEYMTQQIAHGIDVFQLFDTHAGLIPYDLYKEIILPHVKKIAQVAKSKNTPFIFFPKGISFGLQDITPDYCDFISIDWQTSIETARKMVHSEIGLQGNIDPRILFASQQEIESYLHPYKKFGQENQNWIFNLGHGFMPGIPYENAKFLVDWVTSTNWDR